MAQLKVYNQDGNLTGEMEAPKFLSGVWNADLAHQVFKALAANKRTPVAHTKNRGEVRGGGIKPWKQKGTGRARHGSTRSPLWRHGGVTHGPRNDRDYSQKINKKMANLAMKVVLAKKFASGQLKVLDDLDAGAKTKDLAKILNNVSMGKSALLLVSSGNQNAVRAARNLKNVSAAEIRNLNLYDILNHQFLILEKKALAEFQIE